MCLKKKECQQYTGTVKDDDSLLSIHSLYIAVLTVRHKVKYKSTKNVPILCAYYWYCFIFAFYMLAYSCYSFIFDFTVHGENSNMRV